MLGTVGAEILDQHIALVEKVVKEAVAFGVSNVERQGTLIAIAGKEICGLSAKEGGAPAARVVALARAFDLDDLRAEIAEDLSAERTGQNARSIENAQPVQCGRWIDGYHQHIQDTGTVEDERFCHSWMREAVCPFVSREGRTGGTDDG
jgi:hypothetical protein